MQQMTVGEWETATGLEDSTRTLVLILLEKMCGMMEQEVRVRVGHGSSDDPAAHYFWSSKKTDMEYQHARECSARRSTITVLPYCAISCDCHGELGLFDCGQIEQTKDL